MRPDWRVILDFNPVTLSRERVLKFCQDVDPQVIRDIYPVGTPRDMALRMKGYADAGMKVFKMLDYSGVAGARFAPASAAEVLAEEDELLRLCSES